MFSIDDFNIRYKWNYPLSTTPPKVVEPVDFDAALLRTGRVNSNYFFAVAILKEKEERVIVRLISNKKKKSCLVFTQLREYLDLERYPVTDLKLYQVYNGKAVEVDADGVLKAREGDEEAFETYRRDVARRKAANEIVG